MTTSRRPRITPARIFLVVAIALTAFVLFVPISERLERDDRLSTFNKDPAGAMGTYEVLRHLKFSLTRTTDRFADSLSTRPIYAVLDNQIPLSDAELHVLQDAVRRGAGLVLATENDSLAAAFGFSIERTEEFLVPIGRFSMTQEPVIPWDVDAVMSNADPGSMYTGLIFRPSVITPPKQGWAGPVAVFMEYDSTGIGAESKARQEEERQHAQAEDSMDESVDSVTETTTDSPLPVTPPAPRRRLTDMQRSTIDSMIALSIRRAGPNVAPRLPVMLGTTFGAGKVVFLSEPSLIANQTARGLPPTVAFVNALQWMGGEHRLIVFDEYHQGYGLHADIPQAIWTALSTTRLGWMASQGLVALLLVLAALALRPLPPHPQPRVQRRSPLEHVTALANAYTQTDARAFGIDQLIRGLRRRHPLGVNRNAPVETYFTLIKSNFPTAHDTVDALVAMYDGNLPAKLADAAALVAAIEAQFPSTMGRAPTNRSSQFL